MKSLSHCGPSGPFSMPTTQLLSIQRSSCKGVPQWFRCCDTCQNLGQWMAVPFLKRFVRNGRTFCARCDCWYPQYPQIGRFESVSASGCWMKTDSLYSSGWQKGDWDSWSALLGRGHIALCQILVLRSSDMSGCLGFMLATNDSYQERLRATASGR